MKRLYFVRHGQTEMNVSGHYSGITDTQLTSDGKKQAKLAGKIAKTLNIDYIICSPLSRAHNTAKIIAKEIGYPVNKIHINKLFIERDFGKLEGTIWMPDMDLDGISDIETRDTILERAKLGFEFLQNVEATNVLVVSHGSFGRALRSVIKPEHTFHNVTTGGHMKDGIPNAEIVQWI